MFRVLVLFLAVLLLGISGIIVAQDGPPVSRPSLAECVEGESIPCIEIVDNLNDIVGTWRRYFMGGTQMAYSIITEDGSSGTTFHPDLSPNFITTTTFEDGLAVLAANENQGAGAECEASGRYEVRMIRLGEQPIALTFLRVEDSCPGRIADLSEPLLYVTDSSILVPRGITGDFLVESLIPCPEEINVAAAYPCDVIATSPQDIAGVWRQYIGNPAFNAPNGMGYIRYNDDGSYALADSLENTATPYEAYPFGSVSFDDKEMTFTVDSEVPPGCETAVYIFRVIRFGNQPVAIVPSPVNDECVRRREGDMAEALIWVSEG